MPSFKLPGQPLGEPLPQQKFDALEMAFPIRDQNIASPNNAVRKLVHQAYGICPAALAGGTYTPFLDGSLNLSNAAVAKTPVNFRFDPAKFAVVGKTTQLVVRTSISTNAAAPAINFTVGYSALTGLVGGVGVIGVGFGAAAGSTAVVNAPGAAAVTAAESAAFAAFASNSYTPTVLTSGAAAANSWTAICWQLYVLNT